MTRVEPAAHKGYIDNIDSDRHERRRLECTVTILLQSGQNGVLTSADALENTALDSKSGAESGALLAETGVLNPELQVVVTTSPKLASDTRQAVLALVDGSAEGPPE